MANRARQREPQVGILRDLFQTGYRCFPWTAEFSRSSSRHRVHLVCPFSMRYAFNACPHGRGTSPATFIKRSLRRAELTGLAAFVGYSDEEIASTRASIPASSMTLHANSYHVHAPSLAAWNTPRASATMRPSRACAASIV